MGQVFSRAAARAVKQQLAPPRGPPTADDNAAYSSYTTRNTAGQPQVAPQISPSIPQVPLDGSSPAYVATPTVGASRTSISVGPGPIPDAESGYDNGAVNGPEEAFPRVRGDRDGYGYAGPSNGAQDDAGDIFGEAEGLSDNSSSARGSDSSRGVVRAKTSMRTLEPAGAAR